VLRAITLFHEALNGPWTRTQLGLPCGPARLRLLLVASPQCQLNQSVPPACIVHCALWLPCLMGCLSGPGARAFCLPPPPPRGCSLSAWSDLRGERFRDFRDFWRARSHGGAEARRKQREESTTRHKGNWRVSWPSVPRSQRPNPSWQMNARRKCPHRLTSSKGNAITCSGAASAGVLLVRAHLLVAYFN
jgi:hypothetical protein